MRTHTNNYKNNIRTFGREIDVKISYTIDNTNVELGSEELNSITLSYEGSILKSVMRGIEIDSNVEISVGTALNFSFGVKVGNNYEYLDYGTFIVKEVEKQEDLESWKIICYDKMLYTMKNYEEVEATYPCTIHDYIVAICDKLNLTFKNENTTFPNYNREIASDLYAGLGYTYRDVLTELAQVTASTICINEDDDELELRYINTTNDTIDEEFFKDINVKFGQKFGPINSIVLSRAGESDNIYMQDDESIEQNGLCEIKIVENQIMNFNDRSDYLQDIFDTLNGLEYYINDFSSTGITYYDLCDRYNVSIGENTYSCIMFNDEINITQGLSEEIFTKMPEESETDYKKADKTDRRINQAYIIVDKQNQQIESLTSTVSQVSEETNNKYQDLINKFSSIDEALTQISSIENRVTQLQTDTYTKTEVQQIANGVGVDGVVVSVVTSTAGTFDENGLTIEKTNAKTKGNFNETGITVMDATGYSDEELLFAGYDNDLGETIVRTKNINVSKYLTIGQNSRLEDYEDGTGIFFIGS